MFHRRINRVFGHLTVRGPFPTCDGHEAGRAGDAGEMRPNEGFGGFGVGVTDEGADTGPGGEDVSATDLNVAGVDVFTELAEDPVDVFFGGDGRVC